MLAHFKIHKVMPDASFGWPENQRWPDHLVVLSNGNRLILRWDEVESANCRDVFGQWMPRAPQPGDTLIVDEDGQRMAVLTENVWRWKQREDCRKIN